MSESENLNPLALDEDTLNFDECVQALLRHGDYWFDPSNGLYFAYNKKFYIPVDRFMFEKRLSALAGENFNTKNKEEVLAAFKARIATPLQSNPELPEGYVNLENGVLDIRTRELLKHSSKFYFFNIIPTPYDPNARCPKWLEFLDQVLLGRPCLDQIVQEMFGYCLIPGNWLQKAFFPIGVGANGKSTLLEVLRTLLGRANTSCLSLGDLGSRFRTIHLWNKYANICEESPSSKAIDAELFKSLTGEGTVAAEEKFKPAFQFECKAKMIFAANTFPKFLDHTEALYRRLIVIPFDYKIPEDKRVPNFNKTLLAELPGILNWALEGLNRVREQNRISYSKYSDQATKDMIRSTDTVAMFLDERCDVGPNLRVQSHKLYQEYKFFCQINGYSEVGNQEFGRRLHTHFPSVERKRESQGNPRPWCYEGLHMRGSNEESGDDNGN